MEDDVYIGDGCRLEARSSVKSGTTLGENNFVGEGTIIGGMPQHIAIQDDCGCIVIGNGNIIRENVTIHRAMKETGTTEIGDNCMFMINAHVAHDCRIGNNVILTNNVMLAGHVSIGDRAILGGAAAVHQFSRVGKLAMVGGQSHVIQDVPPFMTVDGLTSRIVGLNQIGLRRAGFTIEDVKQLKAAYRTLFRSQLPWREILKTMEADFTKGLALELVQFLRSTTRGILNERRSGAEGLKQQIFKIHEDEIDESDSSFKFNAG